MNVLLQIMPYLCFAVFISFTGYIYLRMLMKWDKMTDKMLMNHMFIYRRKNNDIK